MILPSSVSPFPASLPAYPGGMFGIMFFQGEKQSARRKENTLKSIEKQAFSRWERYRWTNSH